MAIELFNDGESGESIRTKINANFVNLDDRLTAREEIDLPALLGLLAPPIVSQPSGGMVATGSSRTLSVTTGPQVGQAPTLFQWQSLSGETWSDIPGATSSTYTTPALFDDVTLRVKLSNAFGDTYSTIVTVSVLGFAVQPQSGDFYVGNNVTFTATSNLSGASYRWQEWDGDAWQNITGATSGTYSVNGLALGDDAREFRCVISINGVQAISNTATITVFGITTQPTEEVTLEGVADTYTIATNKTEATYQWQRSTDGGTTWSDLAASNETSLAVSGTQANNGRKYRCVAMFRALSIVSDVVTRHVLFVTTQPASVSIMEGQTASFSAAASVTGSVLQWQRYVSSSWQNISGATSSPYSIVNAQRDTTHNVPHRCVMSAGGVSVTSSEVSADVYNALALPGVTGWFKPAMSRMYQDRSTTPVTPVAANGDPVGTWIGEQAGVYAMALSDATRGSYSAIGMQSKDAITLDGVDDDLRFNGLADSLRGASYFYLAIVAQVTGTGTFFLASTDNSASGRFRLNRSGTTLNVGVRIADSDIFQEVAFSGVFANSNPRILLVEFAAAEAKIRVINNGGAEVTQNLTLTPGSISDTASASVRALPIVSVYRDFVFAKSASQLSNAEKTKLLGYLNLSAGGIY